MKIAILGLGIIGTAWANNLVADGLDVACWNRTPKDFHGFVPTAPEAVSGADFVIIVVSDPDAVQAVIDNIMPVLQAGQLVIQSSTISPRWSREFAQQIESTGARFLEAPFTGSKPAAEDRKTIFYVGGEADVVEAVLPVLTRLSANVMHIGPLGAASSLKLAMNLNLAGIAQALAESLTLARAEGISDDTFFSALKVNAGRSGFSDMKEPKLRGHDYSPQFSVKHMGKDLRLALETASEANLSIPQTKQLYDDIYTRGLSADLGDQDFVGLIQLLGQHKSK